MTKTRSMTSNQNNVDTCKKRSKAIDKGYLSPWLDINEHALFLVMMKLGVIDFLAFSGVCKLWRSFALSNKEAYMASRQPMLIWISGGPSEKECYLEDFKGRKYKTLLPHSDGRTCLGLTCGYVVLFGRKTRDLWLVNPITRNELHFPAAPYASPTPFSFRAILVVSPVISGCVFVMIDRFHTGVWFSIAGKGSWNHVSCTFQISDLLVFKGTIYILANHKSHIYEVRLYPEPKLVLLHETNNSVSPFSDFVCAGGNLYVVNDTSLSNNPFEFHKFDFGEKVWVRCEKITEEYACFNSSLGTRRFTAIKPESWAEHQPRYGVGSSSAADERGEKDSMWYFPQECFNVNLKDE